MFHSLILYYYYRALGQAVRNGQALNLDRDVSGYSPLETEKRRRIWWELFCCDTYVNSYILSDT